MKNYQKINQAAWEEAFAKSSEDFKMKPIQKLKEDPTSLLSHPLREALKSVDLNGKVLGHFCVNSGRETMALLNYGLKRSVGFDIAENMVVYANQVSQDLNLDATFYARDILAIEDTFKSQFDIGLFTIGALCWFEDLDALFKVVAKTIKSGGTLIIEDSHPITNMLGTNGEAEYDEKNPKKLVHNYFKNDPWVEGGGMGYMGDNNKASKTFISYSHTLTEVFKTLKQNGFIIEAFSEYQKDLSNLFLHLENQGIPLSYTMVLKKR